MIAFIAPHRVSQIGLVVGEIEIIVFFKSTYKNCYSIDFSSLSYSHAYGVFSLTITYIAKLNAVKSTNMFFLTRFQLNSILTAINSQQQVLLQKFVTPKESIH